ncbi:MAG TPA: nicotinate-nucleotide adenylyltransferase [Gammaproteobacteria bacterium]|nr:nicotinate-nucleotide adenylyltransferase [Gammaproteobacteria bacterium]
MRKIGIFGGSFDPVHFGHLRPAFEILQTLALDEIRLVPAGKSPLRDPPVAPAALRLQMLQAAVHDAAHFIVDERELRRPGPSYTVDTLTELRQEFPQAQLALIVGMDAFLGFTEWHEWRSLFKYAHIIVAHRPGWELPGGSALTELLCERRVDSAAGLWTEAAGRVLLQPVTQLEISSTRIRAAISAGGDPLYLVPEPVRDLILNSHCYTQAVVH